MNESDEPALRRGDFTIVRFALRDARQRRFRHPGGWDRFEGLRVAYFAGHPMVWWPYDGFYPGGQDGPYPFPVEVLPEGWKIKYVYPWHNRDEGIVLRLTRSALASERTPFEFVGDEPEVWS